MASQFQFRNEVSSYIKACEHLISAATMPGNEKFTIEECQVINYYAEELSKVTGTDATVVGAAHGYSFPSIRTPRP